MSQVLRIIKNARRFAALQGWSKARLSREAELHSNTLRSLDHENFNPCALTLIKIERFLKAHAHRLQKKVP